MGCTTSAEARASTVSSEAAQKIKKAVAEADLQFKQGLIDEAVSIVTTAKNKNLRMLIGVDSPAYHIFALSKLAEYRQALGEYKSALKLYSSAASIALTWVQNHREGAYIMVQRYTNVSVASAQCHLLLLDMEQEDLEEARYAVSMQASCMSKNPARNPFCVVTPPEDSGEGSSSMRPLSPTIIVSPGRRKASVNAPLSPGPKLNRMSSIATPQMRAAHLAAMAKPLRIEELEKMVQHRIETIEALLLTCIENIDMQHSHRSEMMIEPLTLLAVLYEQLGMWVHCERQVRKLSGIYLVKYGHSHPAYTRARDWLSRLETRREEDTIRRAVTNIVKTWKMRKAMVDLARRLGKDPNEKAVSDSESDSDDSSPFAGGFSPSAGGRSKNGLASPRPKESAAAVFAAVAGAKNNDNADEELQRRLKAVPKHHSTADAWITADPDGDEPPTTSSSAASNPPPVNPSQQFSVVRPAARRQAEAAASADAANKLKEAAHPNKRRTNIVMTYNASGTSFDQHTGVGLWEVHGDS